jgi:hypothetical protein
MGVPLPDGAHPELHLKLEGTGCCHCESAYTVLPWQPPRLSILAANTKTLPKQKKLASNLWSYNQMRLRDFRGLVPISVFGRLALQNHMIMVKVLPCPDALCRLPFSIY